MAFLGLARQARTVEKQGNTTHPLLVTLRIRFLHIPQCWARRIMPVATPGAS